MELNIESKDMREFMAEVKVRVRGGQWMENHEKSGIKGRGILAKPT